MSEDAMAKIKLADGREVWRQVSVRFREVESGRWLSAEEVQKFYPADIVSNVQKKEQASTSVDQIRQQIVDVQAQIAIDRQAGAQSTSAARLVLKTLSEIENTVQKDQDSTAWFILGRQLAEQVLRLVEEELDRKSGLADQN